MEFQRNSELRMWRYVLGFDKIRKLLYAFFIEKKLEPKVFLKEVDFAKKIRAWDLKKLNGCWRIVRERWGISIFEYARNRVFDFVLE